MHILIRNHQIAARPASRSGGGGRFAAPAFAPPPPLPLAAHSNNSIKRRTGVREFDAPRRRQCRTIARVTPQDAGDHDDDDDIDADAADDADAAGPPPLPPPASPAALAAAALAAVDSFVRPGSVVGLGRGELVQRVVSAIGRRISEGRLGNVTVVPSAASAAAAAAFHGVPIATASPGSAAPASASASVIASLPAPTVFFDEADQLDARANAYLSGSRAGEAAHPDLPAICELVERTLARGGEVVALPASARACVPRLNAALPVALGGASTSAGASSSSSASPSDSTTAAPLPAWEEAAEELDDIFLGDAELWRRPQDPRESANPRGGRAPLVQPDGSTLVDVRFYEGLCLFGEADADYARILEEIAGVPGVVATGLFVGKATAAVVPPAAAGGAGEEGKPRVLVRGEGGALVDEVEAAKV